MFIYLNFGSFRGENGKPQRRRTKNASSLENPGTSAYKSNKNTFNDLWGHNAGKNGSRNNGHVHYGNVDGDGEKLECEN